MAMAFLLSPFVVIIAVLKYEFRRADYTEETKSHDVWFPSLQWDWYEAVQKITVDF